MKKSFFLPLVAAVMISPVWAADTQGSTTQATTTPPTANATAESPDLDKIVCKRLAPPTGTRLGARTVCQSQREWDKLQRESAEALRHQQEKGGGPGPGAGG